ncbi:MAG: hypothetical protein JO222_15810 [Frankiales bacterium]|nr:hypothetical protein [Frankiales bacterium]
MKTRLLASVIGAVATLLLTAGPAFALESGEVRGKPLGAGLVIVYYVLIPVGAFLVISFFSALPSMLNRPRYRPGRPWKHDPLWFNGPDDPDSALAGARPGATARGGASAEW